MLVDGADRSEGVASKIHVCLPTARSPY